MMILKEKEGPVGQDERSKAGYKQERNVAFYLRREFGDDPTVLIIKMEIGDGARFSRQ
ncbi:MAG: hypothetical protein JZU65_24810 [Chlorobium sp.]|nr:hypothetical protein [Chlorobium sp.]